MNAQTRKNRTKIDPASLRKTPVGRIIKEYGLITLGLLLFSFSWTGIILPAGIVGGGASGLATLIFYASGGALGHGIPIGISLFTINGVLIGIASFLIGWRFGAKTIYAVFLLSAAMSVMQHTIPPGLLGLAEDRLLSAILGGALSGIGVAICFMQGGSTGGTDIVAMIINKYRQVSYGRVIMACDLLIIGSSYFVGYDISVVIYSYLIVVVSSYTLDSVLAGNRQSAQVFIISRHYSEIADHVVAEMRRGVTLLDGQGWYTREPVKMLMVVCRKNETSILFRIVREYDPKAFITVESVTGVYGEGFEALRK